MTVNEKMTRTNFVSGTTITSSWLNRVDSHVTEVHSLKDFGAVGDGATDDTDAIQLWLSSLTSNSRGHIPAGVYRFTRQLIAPNVSKVSISGDGPYVSCLIYNGAATNISLFVFGDSSSNLFGWNLSNFRLDSQTTMTAGAGFHFQRLDDCVIRDVLAGGHTGNQLLFNGYHFDGAHVVLMSGFGTKTRNDGIIVNGRGTGTDTNLYLLQGSADTCWEAGLRCAGGFGGLFVEQCEFLGNRYNIAIDTSIQASGNREILIGNNVVSDGVRTSMGHNEHGIYINDSLSSNGSICINGFIGSSVQHGIYLKNWSSGFVSIGANRIFNCASNGISIEDSTCTVRIGSLTQIDSNQGWGIYSSVPTSNIFFSGSASNNSLGNFSPDTAVNRWSAYTPLVSSTAGTLTTATATGAYVINGNTVHAKASISISNNGTASGAVSFTLPNISRGTFTGGGRANTISGKALQVIVNSGQNVAYATSYDGSYPGMSGETLEIHLTFELQ